MGIRKTHFPFLKRHLRSGKWDSNENSHFQNIPLRAGQAAAVAKKCVANANAVEALNKLFISRCFDRNGGSVSI